LFCSSPFCPARNQFFLRFCNHFSARLRFRHAAGSRPCLQNGAGIGGGDIKLAGLIGFAFGPYGMMAILLFATLLAASIGVIYIRRKTSEALLHMAYVPFMTVGSLIAAAAKLFI
jgi:prepilin signal peptidase PulO-like enzyme (type II secretory pathway)